MRCMTLDEDVPDEVYYNVTDDIVKQVTEYIEAPMTATVVKDDGKKSNSKEIVTSELIYYWMIALNIPHEYEKWHLNRLLTLIKVCNVKNQPAKKMSKRDIMNRNAALNAARRKQFNTTG